MNKTIVAADIPASSAWHQRPPGLIEQLRQVAPTLWLNAKIAGHHEWAFKQAIDVFEGIKWMPENVT